MFESCRFRRFRGQTLRLSILLDAGRRPALRNICKIAKFVDTAENEPKEVFLIWKCFIFRIDCLAVYAPAIFSFSQSFHYFIDFMSEASVDWGRIVVAKPASPVSMISHDSRHWVGTAREFHRYFLSIFCLRRVRIEVELFAQNRPPLSLWSLIWTGWKPRFHRFFEDFKGRKYALIACAVSAAPFSFFEHVWFRGKDAYFRELLRISKKEKWVDFCL